jgi:hypothetical protein
MAKEILEERREIALPKPADPTKLYAIEKVDLEKRLGDIVPDVTVYIEGRPILIEVVVTHGIDEQKREAIRELEISTLVIDLSDETRTISKDELAQILVEGTEKKRWEFNRVSARKKRREWETKLRFKVTRRNGSALHVDGCPKPGALRYYPDTPYANVRLDCYECEFLVIYAVSHKVSAPFLSEDIREFMLSYPATPEGYILCGWPKIAEKLD